MNTYTATVTRDDRFWMIRVKDVALTQARKLVEVEPMARDLIATWFDVPADSFGLTIEYAPEIAGPVARAADLRQTATTAKSAAEYATAEAARILVKQGVSTRDAAQLLNVSAGWISVITATATEAA